MNQTLNQKTYDRLKEDILTMALKPGESVSAAKIAERYQVSRTPAREALVRLEAEGMVEIFPKSGTVISRINVHRVRQEWFIRKTLELGMADAFIRNLTDRDLELMNAYNEEMKQVTAGEMTPELAYQYLTSDNDFHGVTYMAAGERLSASIIYTMTAHYNRLRLLIDVEGASKQRTLADHETLMKLAMARDSEGYRKTLESHLGHIVKDIERMREKYPDYFED